MPSRPKFWNHKKKDREKKKNLKTGVFGISGVFSFGVFGVFSGSPRISTGGYFFCLFLSFLWKVRVGPSRGSVASRGILNTRVFVHEGFGFWPLRAMGLSLFLWKDFGFLVDLVAMGPVQSSTSTPRWGWNQSENRVSARMFCGFFLKKIT